ncbi:MAG TPA: OmpA family protein, partial [Bacteroidia bacterium]|nr:OmpA family protein [Bacteroidia bacterium]
SQNADIYSFKVLRPTCSGTIVSADTKNPLLNATAIFVDYAGDTILASTNSEGEFSTTLPLNKAFRCYAIYPGHLNSSKLILSTIGLGQGVNVCTDTMELAPFQYPQNVVIVTVSSLSGKSLLSNVSIDFFSENEQFSAPRMEMQIDRLLVHADRALDFYLDVETAGASSNSWHYIPQAYEAGDTIKADIVLDDSTTQVKRIIVAEAGTANVPGMPVAKLILFDHGSGKQIQLAYDIGVDEQGVRIATPLPTTQRCSLVVMKSGFIPAVFDPRRDIIPDSVYLAPANLRYSEPITIFHKFNEKEPDYLISSADLEGISQYLIQDQDAILQINSHTDCRGSDSYNLQLSKRRAQMVKDFIVGRTHSSFGTRIRIQGLGEKSPAIACTSDFDCPEEVHARNRRTEIFLVRPDQVSSK